MVFSHSVLAPPTQIPTPTPQNSDTCQFWKMMLLYFSFPWLSPFFFWFICCLAPNEKWQGDYEAAERGRNLCKLLIAPSLNWSGWTQRTSTAEFSKGSSRVCGKIANHFSTTFGGIAVGLSGTDCNNKSTALFTYRHQCLSERGYHDHFKRKCWDSWEVKRATETIK